jgi:hypothetical protein
LIGGLTVNTLSTNAFSATSQMLVSYIYERYTGLSGSTLFFASNNFAMRRSQFLELGGFAPACRWAEDREFCQRWHQAGLPAQFAPEAVVHHAHELALSSFLRQHFNYGRGAFQFRTVLVTAGQHAVKLERLEFYKDLLLYPWRSGQHPRRWSCSGLMALSQVANVAGYGFEALVGAGSRFKGASVRSGTAGHALGSGVVGDADSAAVRIDASHMATSEKMIAPTT